MPKQSNKDGQKYEYGCLMLDLKGGQIPHYAELLAAFDPKDLYESKIVGEFGIEYEPHVTVLFGFHDDGSSASLPRKIMTTVRRGSIPVRLTGVSNFHNSEYDVVKFTVQSPALVSINAQLAKKYDHTSNFAYNPHLTLAYVKAGKGPEYCEKLWKLFGGKPVAVAGHSLCYSRPNGDKLITRL